MANLLQRYNGFFALISTLDAMVRFLPAIIFSGGRHGTVPTRNNILRWVQNLRTTGIILKKKSPGPRKTVRTPENVERVRLALIQSPSRLARRHA
ncbi:hypothetical protein J6590_095475, partial [Homalodisca vitripennis]